MQLIAILFFGFAALSSSKAAPILVSGRAVNAFDLSLTKTFSGQLFFSGTNGVDRIIVTSSNWSGPVDVLGYAGHGQRTHGSLNGVSFSHNVSFALGGGGGFAKFGSVVVPLQSFFTFTHRVYLDTTPTRVQYEDHYLISATEPLPEPSSVILGLLGIVALALLKVKGNSGESPKRG